MTASIRYSIARHFGRVLPLVLGVVTPPLLAQVAPDAAPPATERDETVTLPALVVTAQKRKEDVTQVPSSISVISAEKLQDQGVTQLSDLAGFVPSLQIQNNGSAGRTSVAIRGIQTLGPGAVIGSYIDDVPVGSSNNFTRASLFVLDLLPDEIERMEVLRGPQGTLYGATAMGGWLKYVLAEPSTNGFSAYLDGSLSALGGADRNGYDARAGMNAPLASDLAVRVAAAANYTPGWIDDTTLHRHGINNEWQRSGRVTFGWKPADGVDVKFTALRQAIDAADDSIILLDPVTLRPLYGDNATNKPIDEPFKKSIDLEMATLNWELPWADFVSATSYSNTSTHVLSDASAEYGVAFPAFGVPPGISAFHLDLGLKKWTQEFRLASKEGSSVEWLIGAFYTREQSTNQQYLSAQTMSGGTIPDLDPLLRASLPAIYREKALFGDLTYRFSDQFDVTAGLRYAGNDQDYRQVVEQGTLAPASFTHNTSSENVATYLLAPSWHFSPTTMLYARIASGYRPGGPNIALPNVPPSVKSDTLVNTEVGLKSLFLDNRASLDMALYQTHWKDIQLYAVTPNGLSYFANAGTATTRGVEWMSQWQVTNQFLLGASASYTNAFLTEDAPSLGGKSGDRMFGIPRWSGSVRGDYSFELPRRWNGRAGLSYGWYGSRTTLFAHSNGSYPLSPVGELNAFIALAHDNLTWRLYGKNLTGAKDYINLANVPNAATGEVVEVQANRPTPRVVGVELEATF